MIKLQTAVDTGNFNTPISFSNNILILGSCFADNIGSRMLKAGFNACVNPFGTLYNPISILNAVKRLSSGKEFIQADCVEMGAGAGLTCSFSHHTSFARKDSADFLESANKALKEAAAFWNKADTVMITLGTAWVWKLKSNGEVVSNCLKRPASEFSHELLSIDQCRQALQEVASLSEGKRIILTVSPIRHLSMGAHANQLSKSTLLLASDGIGEYFPSYELVLDELRDYRFYAEDLVHPSETACNIIWERFMDATMTPSDRQQAILNEKETKRAAHRPLH